MPRDWPDAWDYGHAPIYRAPRRQAAPGATGKQRLALLLTCAAAFALLGAALGQGFVHSPTSTAASDVPALAPAQSEAVRRGLIAAFTGAPADTDPPVAPAKPPAVAPPCPSGCPSAATGVDAGPQPEPLRAAVLRRNDAAANLRSSPAPPPSSPAPHMEGNPQAEAALSGSPPPIPAVVNTTPSVHPSAAPSGPPQAPDPSANRRVLPLSRLTPPALLRGESRADDPERRIHELSAQVQRDATMAVHAAPPEPANAHASGSVRVVARSEASSRVPSQPSAVTIVRPTGLASSHTDVVTSAELQDLGRGHH